MLTSDTAENISPQHNNYLAERTNRLKFNINALLTGEGPICLHWLKPNSELKDKRVKKL